MDSIRLARRRFVVAVIALAGGAGVTLQTDLFRLSRAWAESPGQLDAATRNAMLQMARRLYPHQALPDSVYAGVLDAALADVAAGAAFAREIEQAAAALEASSGGDWLDLDAAAQAGLLRRIESEPYFAAIANQVRVGIYTSQAFWKQVGYPGPSKDFGGYLHRGAGEIDWLDEVPG